jgi:hypothetical protein
MGQGDESRPFRPGKVVPKGGVSSQGKTPPSYQEFLVFPARHPGGEVERWGRKLNAEPGNLV